MQRKGMGAQMLNLTNTRLFDGRRMLPGRHSVTVDGSTIVAVDQSGGDGRTVDLDGMTLLPGLITSHYHPDFYRFSLADGIAGNQIGKELPPGVLAAIGVRNCGVLIESGFTGYLGAGCAFDLDASLKMAIAEGFITGPRIRACGHHVNTTGSANDPRKWWQRYETPGLDIYADGPDALRALVRDEIRRGVDTIKIIGSQGHAVPAPRIKRNMGLDEIATVVETAHDRGACVRAHVSERDRILECIDLGVDIIDHGDEMDEACIDAMVRRGTFWVPSLAFSALAIELGLDPGDGEFSRGMAMGRKMLPLAQEAGVRVMIGDDYSGFLRELTDDDPLDHEVGCYGRELAFYGGFEGLAPETILSWATANPGILLGEPGDKVGVIEVGAKADLIVVDGDPLGDLALFGNPRKHLRALIANGVLLIDRLQCDAKIGAPA